MKKRKMNNYSIIHAGSVLVLAIVLVLSTFAFSLGTRTDANPLPNNPPNTPIHPGPGNGSTDISISAKLNWTGGDPDNDKVTYNVYFGTTSSPSIKSINQTTLLYNPGTMNYSTIYYWRIIAWDNHSASTKGPLWHFTTVPNAPPNKPNNPYPANNSTNIPTYTNLNWTGGDPYNDTVTYDVYFGTTNNPPKKVTNQSALIYNPGPMNFTTLYYWKIVAWDNHKASTQGQLWSFTTKPNSPPNTPSNPSPTNGAPNVLRTATLGWTGGDPDKNDTVTYDVYFGTTSPPSIKVANQSALSYNPGTLSYKTIYYWKIISWDNHKASTQGQLWSFTTKALPTVNITKPLKNTLYFQDQVLTSIPITTIVYGAINITAEATSGVGIARVEFFIDGISVFNDTLKPYIYLWNPPNQINNTFPLKHTIKVVAYDSGGDSASAKINVTKWRFHPLPFIAIGGIAGVIAGVTIASTFIKHTIVSGLFFNVKNTMLTTSFYALRIHYWTTGPFKHVRGVVNFKSCTGGPIIGPLSLLRIGPLHNIMYGTFTFLGDIQYTAAGFGQGSTTPSSTTTLKI